MIVEAVKKFAIGPITFSSVNRGGTFAQNGYHAIQDTAADFVPQGPFWFWLNVALFDLFWPGGFGYDPNLNNRHIHADFGPKRRWVEGLSGISCGVASATRELSRGR